MLQNGEEENITIQKPKAKAKQAKQKGPIMKEERVGGKWLCEALAGPPNLFLKLQTGSVAQEANSNILERHFPPDSLSQIFSPHLERNPPLSWQVIATVSLHSSLGNLKVSITSTHLSSYFTQVAIIPYFKERKKNPLILETLLYEMSTE